MKPVFIGKWRLIEMEQWDQDFIDLVEPGFISFQRNGQGEMKFGAVELQLDCMESKSDKLEFTFDGFDEGDEVSGCGWIEIKQDQLVGRIQFHEGDESGFSATSWSTSKTH